MCMGLLTRPKDGPIYAKLLLLSHCREKRELHKRRMLLFLSPYLAKKYESTFPSLFRV